MHETGAICESHAEPAQMEWDTLHNARKYESQSICELGSLDMLMSLEIRRNSCEKPRHADEP